MVASAIIDQLFFQRIDVWQTQAVFAAYTAICFITIPLTHVIEERAARGKARPRWRGVLPIITQFSLGGFWSGFLVFYGRSAAVSASWPFLLLIVVILVANEFLKKYHDRLVFTSVLFFFAMYSYAIFAVPVYTGMIGTTTFLESGALAIVVFTLFTILLRIFGRERFMNDVWNIRVGAAIVLVVINVCYFTNILPPLPLAAKSAGIYHTVWRVPGNYFAETESQSWRVKYLGSPAQMHVTAGDTLYAYSSIFAPTTLATVVVHRWQWYDPQKKEWITKSRISYPIVGGRDGGYRGYSAVPISAPGDWRVSIETVEGLVIARLPFTAEIVSQEPELQKITLP